MQLKLKTAFLFNTNDKERRSTADRNGLIMIKTKKTGMRLLSLLLVLLMAIPYIATGVIADTTASGGTTATPGTSASPETGSTNPSQSKDTESKDSGTVSEPLEIIMAYFPGGDYKSDYVDGEQFDPTGINIVIGYRDGSTETVSLKKIGNYSPKKLSTKDTKVLVKINEDFTVEIPVSVAAKKVSQILYKGFDSQTYKTTYLEGEIYSAKGLKVDVVYEDGTSETVDPSKLTFSPAGPLKPTDTSVTISFGGKSFSIPNHLKVHAIKSIEVKSNQIPAVFGQYQKFDKSKIIVTAVYENNQDRVVEDYTVNANAFDKAGEGTITFEYLGKKASLKVNILELTGIIVTKKPAKLQYDEGDTFDPTGIEVSGKYNGLDNYPITGFTVENKILEANADGECTVSVSINNILKDTITVKVTPIVELIIATAPTKVSYHEGEAYDLTGIKVNAKLKSGKIIENFKNYKLSDATKYANPEALPVIEYRDVKKTVDSIKFVPIVAIGVDPNNSKHRTKYTEGEVFDPTGIVILAYFEDNTFKTIEPGACTFPTNPLKLEDTTATITYKNFAYDIEIKVSEKVVPVEMLVSKTPKVEYITGQKLDLEGLELTVIFSDASRKILTADQFTSRPEAGTELYAGVDSMVTFTYTDEEGQTVSIDLPLTVNDKTVVSLYVSQKPDKMTYKEGEKFDPAGMLVKAYYNDSTDGFITDFSFPTDPFVVPTDKTTKVEVKIVSGDAEYIIQVEVQPVEVNSISVSTPPTKVNYKPGDEFDPTGMIVKVTYENGKFAYAPIDACDFSQKGAFTATSSNVITVSFRGKTASLTVEIDGSVGSESQTTDTTEGQTTTPPSPSTDNSSGESTDTPETTEKGKQGGMSGTLLIVFISLIVFVVALVVVLVIYYRKNFC